MYNKFLIFTIIIIASTNLFCQENLFLTSLHSSLTNLRYAAARSTKTVTGKNITYHFANKSITVMKADITKLVDVDAIVNAANERLTRGGGVCGAIFQSAGKGELEKEVAKALAGKSSIDVGQACITPIPQSTETLPTINNPKQKIRYVVHAVGPNCNIPAQKKHKNKLLSDAYTNSLLVADAQHVKSIAFPAISTAIFACPSKEAAPVAIQAVLKTLTNTKIKHVFFVFLDEQYSLYIELLDKELDL